MYYGAIFVDLMLRCTWSFKLSPHLDHFNDLEGGIFVMEFLEVLRRWMWIFFRVETEWGQYIKRAMPNMHMLIFTQYAPIAVRYRITSCSGTSIAVSTILQARSSPNDTILINRIFKDRDHISGDHYRL